ncbi:hypothetical protein K2173_005898 [Erythroxylum novogranatense]|uniref:Leucine-rich repeat-containing N-terminal plant-type domain-containing protein n=1 Tax=Erythroxylum novogranatense TaxID=1862640 RepID=A0AAV8U2Z3_9ROSI|nr:hypothetical protein K2173_005898 [Erythroxylum novogranatense]
MASTILISLLFAVVVVTVSSNSEGDALSAWKTHLVDPNNVLSSWNPKEVNPCTWFHVTCNNENSVTRVDLGSAGLSGSLVPQLGALTNLQYLELFDNNFSGSIPSEFGGLKSLISLGLNHNQLSGPIPASLGNLQSLRFMRLNSNRLRGALPSSIFKLINSGNLRIMNISDNHLSGTYHARDSKGFAVTTFIQDPKTTAIYEEKVR